MIERSRVGARGFTLIEILLAMVISMLVLGGVAMLYYGMAVAWMGHKRDDLLVQQQNTMMAVLEQQLMIEPKLPRMQSDGEPSSAISWAQLPGAGLNDPWYLSWYCPNPPAFLSSEPWAENLAIRVFLRFDRREGLSLLWHPEDERISRMDFPRYDVQEQIRVFYFPTGSIVGMEYAYYDRQGDQWERRTESKDSGSERPLPDALVIQTREDGEAQHVIYLGRSGSEA
jgi:competence protein ComGC